MIAQNKIPEGVCVYKGCQRTLHRAFVSLRPVVDPRGEVVIEIRTNVKNTHSSVRDIQSLVCIAKPPANSSGFKSKR